MSDKGGDTLVFSADEVISEAWALANRFHDLTVDQALMALLIAALDRISVNCYTGV